MIHAPELKNPQHELSAEYYLKPKKLYLPFSQHTGRPSIPCIKKTDTVEEGQIIAKADGYISSFLHAPKSGKIINIDTFAHPVLKRAEAVFLDCIDNEKKFPQVNDPLDLPKEKILSLLDKSGIVGMGGASF
ncbi:MAG: hypothetical protein JW867_06135, partial [Candidatus Omnitrophica bacterium]|nr:hypothetical protein [Candidatus Omnitrophota bacterium]